MTNSNKNQPSKTNSDKNKSQEGHTLTQEDRSKGGKNSGGGKDKGKDKK